MTTSDVTRPYLSIGEVLALLLEEFPDVTISKIRFLESQGLIDPERTPSGYRKFFEHDVERLRVILREQRENFLPLKVIRERIESGQIDDTGPLAVPRGIRNVTVLGSRHDNADGTGDNTAPDGPSVQPAVSNHPSSRSLAALPGAAESVGSSSASPIAELQEPPAAFVDVSAAKVAADDVLEHLSASELCRRSGLTSEQLEELEGFGLLAARGRGANSLYSSDELHVATAAASFLQLGVEARHLRAWRQAADREAALFEQMVLPLLRQRNPQARQEAAALLQRLSDLGGDLRRSILAAALAPHSRP